MENKELDLVWKFVNNTNRNIFLTGKAGTGKTTFLHTLKERSLKRMVVVAPTGIAAINAKGITIHSFFQLPFGPIIPDQEFKDSSGFHRKFSKTKINIIKSLDLLVIDEISMVRADLLDGIDTTLRRFKNKNDVFGGVQLLMIGDLQQLSPVVKENDWHLLKHHYKNAFFFSSKAFQNCNAISIELKHIYRQDNPVFIHILNEVRNSNLTIESIEELNKRYLPEFKPKEKDGYIYLTTHNNKAQSINKTELQKLKTKEIIFEAKIDGKFPEFSFPNEEYLSLKVGAQVMFIKNDTSPEKRYFNGKIGRIVYLDNNEAVVKCPDDEFNITVTPDVWENINYSVDNESKEIIEDRIGSYKQLPLRLAWSITIHKSQGLTFEKAIIDTEGAFAHGQTYVALSRCRTLEGLVLTSKIETKQIISDGSVLSFNKNAEDNQPDDRILQHSKAQYQLQLIFEIFNFHAFLYPLNRILDIFYKNRNSVEGSIEEPIVTIKNCVINLLKINNSFQTQLNNLDFTHTEPECNEYLQERFGKATAYFKTEFEAKIKVPFKKFGFTTDNKALEKDLLKNEDILEELISIKQLYFEGLISGFKVETFLALRAKSVFIKDKPKRVRKPVIDSTKNVELFERLRALRTQLAEDKDVAHYQIFTQKSLFEICEFLPTTKQQLRQVNGMGKLRVEKYGESILEVITRYCNENTVDTSDEDVIFEKSKKKTKNTKKTSLDLFKSGKSVLEIAKERELTPNTILNHLSNYIPAGEVKITDLITEDKYNELKIIIPQREFESLSDLKHQLDEKYSYSDLRLVLSDLAINI